MTIKDTVIELVLRAKNLISGEAAAAAASVDNVADSAEGLQAKLRGLEDQAKLIKEFERTSSAVDRTSEAYDKAQLRLGKLADKLLETGPPTARQAQEFEIAQKAVEKTSAEYEKAQLALSALAQETKDAGIDVTDLSGAQRENAKQVVETKRALEDYSEAVDDSSSRLGKFGEQLASGIARFAAWGTAAAAAGAALAFAALTRYTKETAALADQLLDTSDQLGVSTTRLQELGAAARTVGVDQNQLNSILKDMTKNIGAAADDSGRFVKVLESIGLEVSDIINLAPDEQLLKIAETISNLTTEQQVNVLERMGSGASKLLPLLQNNALELERIVKAANDRGAIMSVEELQRLAQVEEAMDRITERLEGLRNKLVLAVAPAFEDIARIVDGAFDTQSAKDFQAVVQELTTQLVGSVRSIVGNFGQFKESAQTVIDTLQFLGNTGVAIFRGIQAAVSLTLGSVSAIATGISELVASLLDGMNKLGLVSDQTLAKARERTENLKATTKDLGAQTAEYGRQALQAGADALNAFNNAESGAKKAAAATNQVAAGLDDVGAAAEGVEERVGNTLGDLAAKQDVLAQEILKTALAIETANAAWMADPSEENLGRVQRLREEYTKLQDLLAGLTLAPPEETGDLAGQMDRVGTSADSVTEKVGRTAGQVKGLTENVRETGDVAEKAGRQSEDSAGRVGASLAGVVNGWLTYIGALSRGASEAFREALGDRGAGQYASELEQRLATVNNRLSDMQGRLSGTGVAGVLRKWAQAGFEVEQSFLEQAVAVQKLERNIQAGDRSASVLRMSVEDIERQFNLLDNAQLTGLMSAVQAVQREVESLKSSLLDTIASLEQEAAALAGDNAEVERLRYKEKEAELQDRLEQAKYFGDKEAIAAAEKALALSRKNYEVRERQARLEDEESRKKNSNDAARDEFNRQRSEQEERQAITRSTSQALDIQPVQTVRLQFSDPTGRGLGDLNVVDSDGLDRFLDALERGGYLTTR